MPKVWKSTTLVLSVGLLLALVTVLAPMGGSVHADNVTYSGVFTEGEAPEQPGSTGCDNANDGGVMKMTDYYVLIDVDCWHSGNPFCRMCDELGDFAYPGYGVTPGDCWFSPCPFADPVPPGNVVTKIEANIRGAYCSWYGGNGLTRLDINGTLVGSGIQGEDCICPACAPLILKSPTYEDGFPGYVYGGTNQLGLNIRGIVGISDVHVRLYYREEPEEEPLPSLPGKPGVSPSTPGAWARPLNQANMSTQVLGINPQQTYANQPVTITTNVVNTGDEGGNYNVALKINGQVEETRMVSVGPLGTQPVKFTVTRSQPGTYNVVIDGHQSSFTVLGSSTSGGGSNVAVPIIAVSLLVIIGVVLVMLVRRRTA